MHMVRRTLGLLINLGGAAVLLQELVAALQ